MEGLPKTARHVSTPRQNTMCSKRVRFGFMYTGPSFTRDLLPALDLRTFESIDNDGADHRRVVITVSRSIPTAFVAASIDAFNTGLADASQGVALVPYDGADIVTFAKSQSLEQHSFYAPFEAKGDGYSAWSADGDMSKRLANELAVDMCGAQERVEGKRAPQVGGVIRATFAAFCFNNNGWCAEEEGGRRSLVSAQAEEDER